MNELQRAVLQSRQIKLEVIRMDSVPIKKPLADRRYRIMVTLIRSDRPRYWNFNCMNCGSKVCELVNMEVYDMSDFYDPNNVNNAGTLKHCKGAIDNMACPYSYFFNMS